MCKGQCPGTAIEGDWRNRSEHCQVWKTLFAFFESELIELEVAPLSQSPRRKEFEQSFVEAWSEGRETTMARLLGWPDEPGSVEESVRT
jgi:uncharacterized protein